MDHATEVLPEAHGQTSRPAAACGHCGQPTADGATFCCTGCAAAYEIVRGLGLERYYERRSIDPQARPLRPDADSPPIDYGAPVEILEDGTARLHLMVEGLHCAACVWLIETVLGRQPGVVQARLNMTTRRLTLAWRVGEAEAEALAASVARLGYRLVPFDPRRLDAAEARGEKVLLRAMAVAGFAAANVMLLSVSVWSGAGHEMGPATRDLMHWLSALIAMPAIFYASLPFLRSAIGAVRHGRTNMDVPISIGVALTTGMSLAETAAGGEHAYFDSAIMLLFFLLIGRYLDLRARGRARSAAEHLLAVNAAAVTVVDPGGTLRILPPEQVRPGMVVLVPAGGRIPVDGEVAEGDSDIDTSLISGESVPGAVRPGDRVFAGTINLTAPLRLAVTAVGEGTLLAEVVRLMEVAEQGRARIVTIADRVSRLYAPVVHLTALATFLAWTLWLHAPWQDSLLNAVAVLIITCPCALALAVPVVQVIASGRLLRRGVLLKSATALERLNRIDIVVFDKTGTLTEGRPELNGPVDIDDLRLAASLAGASRHPLARAVCRAAPATPVAAGVREIPGAGLALDTADGEIRLGNRRFAAGWAGRDDITPGDRGGPELWLARPGRAPVRIGFSDALRADAAAVVAVLKAMGKPVVLLSGDRAPVVERVAGQLGIAEWHAGQGPADKAAFLQGLTAAGRRVLMVGDGLNDAPALSAATVSMSPATAVDVSQTAADVVFQGDRLAPVLEALAVARRSDRLIRQNFALAFLYNVVTVPLAMAGAVTPLLAAVAMSSSSLIVIANALRLARRRENREFTDGRAALPDTGGVGAGPRGSAGLPVGTPVGPV